MLKEIEDIILPLMWRSDVSFTWDSKVCKRYSANAQGTILLLNATWLFQIVKRSGLIDLCMI